MLAGFLGALSCCAPSLQSVVPRHDASLDELKVLFKKRETQFRSIKGLVSLSVTPEHGLTRKINGILSFDSTGRKFRFQGFDSLGNPIVNLVTENNLYQLMMGGELPVAGDMEKNGEVRLRTGPGEKDFIEGKSWLMALNEMRWGGTPLPSETEVLLAEKEDDFLLFRVIKLNGREAILKKKIWLEEENFRPVREEIYDDGPLGYPRLAGALLFEYSGTKKGAVWPDRIKVKLENGKMEVEFLEMNFSPEFAPDFFRFQDQG